MRERLQSFSELRIFSQNVNRNYGYMDSILSSTDYDIYDLLFIQEPPWRRIRSAPSSVTMDGEDVIGAPTNPNFFFFNSTIYNAGLDRSPRAKI